MGLTFIKQVISKIVSTIGKWSFGKLDSEAETLPPLTLIDGKVDLSELGIPEGLYEVYVVARCEGLRDSEPSNVELIMITQ